MPMLIKPLMMLVSVRCCWLEAWEMDMQVAFLHFQWVPQLFILNYTSNLSCSYQRPDKHQNVYLNANESGTIGQKGDRIKHWTSLYMYSLL